jgi:hypothetical protein
MHEQPNRRPAERDATVDGAVLGLLLHGEARGPWSIDEVVREIAAAEQITAIDSLTRLHGAGLVHRLGDFVFATRAAVEFDAIAT